MSFYDASEHQQEAAAPAKMNPQPATVETSGDAPIGVTLTTPATNAGEESNTAQQPKKERSGGYNNAGVCAVKPEFLRSKEEMGQKISLEADGKTRGMNKGSAREHMRIEGSGTRPTFEGELNFFGPEVISRVKVVLKAEKKKGGNQTRQQQQQNDSRKRDRDGADTAATDVTVGEAVVVPPTEGVTAPTTDAVVAEQSVVAPTGDVSSSSGAAAVTAPSTTDTPVTTTTATETVPLVDTAAELRSQRKEAAANEREVHITSPEQIRENMAKRDSLFRNRLILAPLTTVGNLPYRRICQEFGVDNTVSEMAMVYNLNKTQKSEWSLLRKHKSEGTFGIQLAVGRPQDAMTFAKSIAVSGFEYDYIDINCGCPVELIVRNGCGCGLWEKKGRLREITQILAKYQSKPVTIKVRVGADEENPTLHRQVGEYESWGASAVTIHGRSKKQRYTKLANWDYIEKCAQLTNLPTIGNGDIFCYDDVVQKRELCPTVNSYMVGRGALIKPWVYQEIKEERTIDMSSHERFEMLKRYCSYGLSHWGADEKGVETTRRFLCEWLSFLCRYVPVGVLERLPQRINERPPAYNGRDDMETLMASDSVADWIRLSEMILGPAGDKFKFTPKHKSNSYTTTTAASSTVVRGDEAADEG